ncbi:hypothetical protein SP15_264 [Bacillus phage SP-15]|uniref:Uncharacterized protein n=1 Tax=Bacillus phage SP-15 TaxID=1792032 RepID=A0A127AZ54_9CAUD|nr:hypothetical protein SP15_264 [Bacillus phage SP-15]AMM45071.1 hypothetical protein SP15_264 [Bacillus phage SP-15]
MSNDTKTFGELFEKVKGDEPYKSESFKIGTTREVPFEDTITRMKSSGSILYRSDGKAEIHRKFFKSLFCKHEMEFVQYSTGGGWMADVYEGVICTKCGRKSIRKV